jgi:hypothetical protein
MLYSWVSYDSHSKKAIIFLNSINKFIFVMEKSCVSLEVRIEFLNII